MYAQQVLEYGEERPTLPRAGDEPGESPPLPHLTGQQLCEAARCLALERYGLLALLVLHNLGFHSTSDFGEVVFKLIDKGLLRQSTQDRREDFDDVYDFETAFRYEFPLPDSSAGELS